jgi:UDP-2,3-diacylglucosamine pyrophosphatase LpxH
MQSSLWMTAVAFLVLLALSVLSPLVRGATTIPTPAQNEFHFAVLGDSQFHDPATFNRMIDDLTYIRPAFVVQVGDMIRGYSNDLTTIEAEWERFAAQIAPLGSVPFVPVPGNHDLYNAFRRSDSKLVALYEQRWGPSYRAFDYRNSHFIILNSDAPDEEERIGPDQFAWLQQNLATTAAEHIFVFMHRPPDSLTNAEALHELLRHHPVRYVFYGHLHHYHFRERDGIGYVMTNAAADSATTQPAVGSFDHFLHVSVRDADVSFASIKADAIEAPDYASPNDNYEMFDLIKGLAPALVELTPAQDKWLMAIPLTNPTTRDLAIYVECSATDGRWRHEPKKIPVIELEAKQHYELRLSWSNSHSEMMPSCTLRVPYQTHHGDWLQHTMQVTSQATE